METGMNDFFRLILDSGDNFRVAVANIVYPDTASEIDQFSAIGIYHDSAKCPGDKCGVQ